MKLMIVIGTSGKSINTFRKLSNLLFIPLRHHFLLFAPGG
jgi:hypothetical protein